VGGHDPEKTGQAAEIAQKLIRFSRALAEIITETESISTGIRIHDNAIVQTLFP
jgi:hypothetical protein